MKQLTVVCVDTTGSHATHHFTVWNTTDIETAKRWAIAEAAGDWSQPKETVAVRGVFAGCVEPLEWDDEAHESGD